MEKKKINKANSLFLSHKIYTKSLILVKAQFRQHLDCSMMKQILNALKC